MRGGGLFGVTAVLKERLGEGGYLEGREVVKLREIEAWEVYRV